MGSVNRRSFIAGAGATGALAAAGLSGLLGGAPAWGAAAAGGPFEPTWDSVDRHTAAPEWFQDAKFGIYFHWGVFSVPAFGTEWYPRWMYFNGTPENIHHKQVYGDPVTQFPYHRFIQGGTDLSGRRVQFAPKLVSAGGRFDPDEWAQLFVDAGAKYAGPVAEHHDGYSMWNSKVNEWNSVATGPGLDLLKLHALAIRRKGLRLLVAMHHAYNFNGFYEAAPYQSDPSLRKLYGQLGEPAEGQLWFDKLREVVDGYRPDILWQDFRLPSVPEDQRLKFLAYYYNQAAARRSEVVATAKDGFDLGGAVYDFERGGPSGLTKPYWLTDDSLGTSSWSYSDGMGYYSVDQMLHSMIDRVSKGGNMLLNIAPMADGSIPQAQRDILEGMGAYLKVFGESIYATRPWTVFGEGPTVMGGGSFTTPQAGTPTDIRFTRSKSNTELYATVLGWPGAAVNVTTLAGDRIDLSTLRRVQLMGPRAGSGTTLDAPYQQSSGLVVRMPAADPAFAASAYVLKFSFSGPIPELRSEVTGSWSLPVGVFADAGFRRGTGLSVGTYTAAQLKSFGVATRSISSVKVSPAYQVVGYSGDNFTGTAWTIAHDVTDLRTTQNDNAISSVTVGFDPTKAVRLVNVVNGLALDSGGSVAAGSPVKQWTPEPSLNLEWTIVDQHNGFYQVVNVANGMVLDGFGRLDSGSELQQAVWNGGTGQQWQILDLGFGRYKIANRQSVMAIDGGGVVDSGSPAKQWLFNGSPNMLWHIVPV